MIIWTSILHTAARAARWAVMAGCLLMVLTLAHPADAATGRVIKVLPQFLDLQGNHAISPSLYDRDAYQAKLRANPGERSGLRFSVQWKTKGQLLGTLKLRVQVRGVARGNFPKEMTFEKQVAPGSWFSSWTPFVIDGDAYRDLGEVTSWRATLWEDDRLIGEQKSFLW